MAITAFPAIEPSSRAWVPGSQPVQSFATLSGFESRVMLGAEPVGTSLQMSFNNLKEVVALSITDHYVKAKGTFETFALPAAVFAGMTDYGKVTPEGHTWRYASAPSIDWVSPGIANVGVSFVAVHQ